MCLLFLKAFSGETDLWVTLGALAIKKKRKIGKVNPKLTKIRLGRNEISCAEDNNNYMGNMFAVIGTISIFSRNWPNFKNSQKFLQYKWVFSDQILLPYKFHGSSMRGILFFNFASSEPLNAIFLYCLAGAPISGFFFHFLPRFGLPGGQFAHPGRPWLRHWSLEMRFLIG